MRLYNCGLCCRNTGLCRCGRALAQDLCEVLRIQQPKHCRSGHKFCFLIKLIGFRTLGRSGLVVSPLALGTMTFGTPRWGSGDDVSEAVFNAYVETGGNFVDTADVYSGGKSEEMLGGYVTGRGLRDQVVLAPKFSFGGQAGSPNVGGNGRKNIHRALDGSLRRLEKAKHLLHTTSLTINETAFQPGFEYP